MGPKGTHPEHRTDGAGAGSSAQDAADLAGLIEHHGRIPVHVFGSSAGGTVVLNLVVDRPDLVASAAIHEPAIEAVFEGNQDDDLVRRLAEEKRHLEKVGTMIDASGVGRRRVLRRQRDSGTGSLVTVPRGRKESNGGQRSYLCRRAPRVGRLTVDFDSLAASEVPIMISIGTESPTLIMARTKELMRRLPSAHARIMEGAGHVPYRTDPDLWLDTLLTFYQDVAGASP